jgi:radical SAM superfamily enzyme YgiQ (UPF0313 family)
MKILLITPVKDLASKTPKSLMLPQLALHMLEGLTPSEHQVKTVEEEIADINLDEECDLVGISCMTSNAPRAYYLAQEFKKRGKTVVLGGVHPTILPDEALSYADSVVVGEAEGVWEQLLEDFQLGKLEKIYHVPSPPLERYISMKHRKLTKKRLFNVIPVMTTRGCPYHCEFCCVSDIYGKKIRHVPVDNVVRDIKESGGKIFIFLDDNIIGHSKYAKKLFKAIKPLKISWIGQASISFVHDTELMTLAAESGCGALFMGIETVSEYQLKRMRKSFNEIRKVEEAIKKVKDLGIHFHASMVFGFDDDTKAVFPETLEFLMRNKISTTSFNVLTPYPGTKVYEQFKEEGRLLTTDWKYYDHTTVVFKPKHMTPYELQEGKNWVKKEFSKISSILKRLPSNTSHPLLYLAMNWAARKNVKLDYRRLARQNFEIFESKKDVTSYSQAEIQNVMVSE